MIVAYLFRIAGSRRNDEYLWRISYIICTYSSFRWECFM